MRIVHVITRLVRGGADENTIITCNGQAEQGHDISLIYGRDFSDAILGKISSSVKTYRCKHLVRSISPVQDLLATADLIRQIKALNPDVVHTHTSKAGILGRIAARAAGIKHIVHGVHIAPHVNVGRLESAVYTAIERSAARFTTSFIHVSSGMQKAFLDSGIGCDKPHFVVHSGFDLAKFQNATPPEYWWSLLNRDAASPKPPIILMLAALERRKRHREFIEVAQKVVDVHPEAQFLLCGEGPEREVLENLIRDRGLGANVHLLGFRTDAERLIKLADLCALTSTREGLPRVVMQYIAGGRPCVVTHLPGVEEVVADNQNGIIVGQDDFAGVARAIVQLISDRSRLAAMTQHAKQTDLSSWDERLMVDRTMTAYRLEENQ